MGQGKSREIRSKIASVKNTAKITKAMQLVSAAKLRKATTGMDQFKPYFQSVQMVLHNVIGKTSRIALASENGSKKALVVLFAGERALCGAFNSNIVKLALKREEELKAEGYEEVSFLAVGKKAREGLKSFNRSVIKEYNLHGTLPEKEFSVEISDCLKDMFLSGEYGKVDLVVTNFKSAGSRSNAVIPILPLNFETTSDHAENEEEKNVRYFLEPSKDEILTGICQLYMEGRVHETFLESLACEYGARMIAMDSASKNANELISSLTLQLNRARQAAITQEIAEIVGGAAGLE